MHIGLYTDCLAHPATGVEHATLALITGLTQAGQVVTCFHSADPRHPRLQGVRHRIIRKFGQWPLVPNHSCFNGLDVLHLQHPQLPFVRLPAVPVVMTIFDLSALLFPRFHNLRRRVFFTHVLPRYLRKFDAIIASSEATKKDIVRWYRIPEQRITVVYPALQSAPQPNAGKREPFTLSLGTLEPRKNVEGLVKAFAILKARGFQHKLVLAGRKGWGYQRIFSLISKLGLQNDVVYKGYVTEQEKHELYQRAQLFAWPSFYEGFGLPVLEAMAHGTPVVTSNVSSLPEVVGDAAILVDPHSPEDIAAGIEAVLSSSRLACALARKGLKRAQVFSPEIMTRRVTAVYEGVVRQ